MKIRSSALLPSLLLRQSFPLAVKANSKGFEPIKQAGRLGFGPMARQ